MKLYPIFDILGCFEGERLAGKRKRENLNVFSAIFFFNQNCWNIFAASAKQFLPKYEKSVIFCLTQTCLIVLSSFDYLSNGMSLKCFSTILYLQYCLLFNFGDFIFSLLSKWYIQMIGTSMGVKKWKSDSSSSLLPKYQFQFFCLGHS